MSEEETVSTASTVDSDTDSGAVEINSSEDGELFSADPNGGLDTKSKKKKKKQKKKKKNGEGEESATQSSAERDPAAKAENDKRFSSAMDLLSSNDDDSMWIRLSSCGIFDAKTRRLCDALVKNRQVTSLDLSNNGITAEGAKALAAALSSGAAPELILLDLRGNPVNDEGLEAMSLLQKMRRQLKVESGPLPGSEPEVISEAGAGGGEEVVDMIVKSDEEVGPSGSAPLSFMQNSLVRKYFQVGGDEDVGIEAEAPGPPLEDPSIVADRCWEQVRQCVEVEAPLATSPALSDALMQITGGVAEEMANCQLPFMEGTGPEDLRPCTRKALDGLGLLPRLLRGAVPPPGLTPYGRGVPQAAVGIHRVAAAELVSQMLSARCLPIDAAVAEHALLPLLTQLALSHPNNSTLQCVMLRAISTSLHSSHAGLWEPLFELGMGLEPAGTDGAADADAVQPPLQRVLAQAGTAVYESGLPPGRRPTDAGFVIALSTMLRSTAAEGGEGSSPSRLHSLLQADERWPTFASEGGPLDCLLAEQAGTLCGPKPERPTLPFGENVEGIPIGSSVGGNTMISGRDLLAMLLRMKDNAANYG